MHQSMTPRAGVADADESADRPQQSLEGQECLLRRVPLPHEPASSLPAVDCLQGVEDRLSGPVRHAVDTDVDGRHLRQGQTPGRVLARGVVTLQTPEATKALEVVVA